MGNPKVSVVITGFEARFYDEILDLVTLFQYGRFIRRILLEETEVRRGYNIAELGVGNGRNARILAPVVDPGIVVGFDISEDMLKRAREKTRGYGNIRIEKRDIRDDMGDYEDFFHAALMVLAFHGFTPEHRGVIFDNVRRILKPGGKFYIFDYNQMDYSRAPFYFKLLIDKFECPLAEEFLSYDLPGEARKHGFAMTKKRTYVKDLFQYAEFTKV